MVTLSPEGAREAERLGSPVLRGNYTRRHELLLAGLQTARRLVIADDEPETTRQVVETARAINEAIPILVTAPSATDAEHLVAAGASEVLVTEREAILRLAAMVLAGTGADQEAVAREVEALRAELAGRESSTAGSPPGIGYDKPVSLNEEQSASDRCSHTDQAQVVTPGSPGCLECLELGWDWVHLRVCLTCGHVGCCNSSRGRHATKHYQSSGHPIMKSLEPLDDWAWCYEDQQFL